jgi:hypothetical protein
MVNADHIEQEMDVGRSQIMNILKRKREIIDDFENNASSSTSCHWKLYFCLLNIFIHYHIEIISSTINVNKSNITTGTK